MNKRREQIIKYLDGSMTGEEKLYFEKKLEIDQGLKKETEGAKNLLFEMKSASEPDINETYFINILPEFHSRREKNKKFSFSKVAYSLSTVAAIVLIVFIFFKPSGTINYSSLNELSKSLTDSELNAALNQYTDRYSINDLISSASTRTDSIVSNMVASELDLSGTVDGSIADNYVNTDELLNSLDESEANALYSQLINEDIIKGVKQ